MQLEPLVLMAPRESKAFKVSRESKASRVTRARLAQTGQTVPLVQLARTEPLMETPPSVYLAHFQVPSLVTVYQLPRSRPLPAWQTLSESAR